jgi:hypothetical protein
MEDSVERTYIDSADASHRSDHRRAINQRSRIKFPLDLKAADIGRADGCLAAHPAIGKITSELRPILTGACQIHTGKSGFCRIGDAPGPQGDG